MLKFEKAEVHKETAEVHRKRAEVHKKKAEVHKKKAEVHNSRVKLATICCRFVRYSLPSQLIKDMIPIINLRIMSFMDFFSGFGQSLIVPPHIVCLMFSFSSIRRRSASFPMVMLPLRS